MAGLADRGGGRRWLRGARGSGGTGSRGALAHGAKILGMTGGVLF